MAIAREGIPFEAPDGEPVKLLVLIVTPREHEERHVEVLATLTSMARDWKLRTRLLGAADPNHAWEVLEDEESRGFNYFLETPEKNGDGG